MHDVADRSAVEALGAEEARRFVEDQRQAVVGARRAASTRHARLNNKQMFVFLTRSAPSGQERGAVQPGGGNDVGRAAALARALLAAGEVQVLCQSSLNSSGGGVHAAIASSSPSESGAATTSPRWGARSRPSATARSNCARRPSK